MTRKYSEDAIRGDDSLPKRFLLQRVQLGGLKRRLAVAEAHGCLRTANLRTLLAQLMKL